MGARLERKRPETTPNAAFWPFNSSQSAVEGPFDSLASLSRCEAFHGTQLGEGVDFTHLTFELWPTFVTRSTVSRPGALIAVGQRGARRTGAFCAYQTSSGARLLHRSGEASALGRPERPLSGEREIKSHSRGGGRSRRPRPPPVARVVRERPIGSRHATSRGARARAKTDRE